MSIQPISELESPQVLKEFRNEPPTDFSKRQERETFLHALGEVRDHLPFRVPLMIDNEEVEGEETMTSLNPSEREETEKAIRSARAAFPEWARKPAEERAGILLRAADIMRKKKHFLSAVEVFEAGKPWREADGDLDEAIDFIEYYAREAIKLGEPVRLQRYLLGEHNDLSYHPLGVVGVIGPWNFPLAIPAGMTSAALVTGNAAILKPAEQTPLITWFFAQALREAGVPPGVFHFLPGRGKVCGAHMVKHPQVNMIVFTGSRDVGLAITRATSEVPEGQPFVKRIVTEMGGKNAIVVDSSADMDSSVPDVLYSAFGFSRQKCSACSRLIVLDDLYDEYMKRLREGIEALKIGPAENPGTQVGPVIDEEAAAKIESYRQLGKDTARLVYTADVDALAKRGTFAAPTLFEVDDPQHRLMQEEIFGPVLAAIRVRSFEEALEVANSTPYALTGGVHSRTMRHLEIARRDFETGNLYLNRTITGAIVGRQPFGGYKLSGIGSKTGGPDYLKQFLVARAVSENMMRHGMASLNEDG